MPFKIVAPKAGRSPFYRVRGTEFGQRIDRTTGTADKKEALRFLKRWRDEAQRDALSGGRREEPTFADAAMSYVNGGGEERFLLPILDRIGTMKIADIRQTDIDDAAVALYPNALPATRNRQVYAPISVILRRAGREMPIRRPKGAASAPRLHWLRPEEAFALLDAARAVDERFGALLTFLLYCGPRLSEALRLTWDDVDLTRATATMRDTKNGSDIVVHLPVAVVASLGNLEKRARVFGLSKCGRLYSFLGEAESRSGIALPPRSAFHILRHTHATWRRLYTGADADALVATGLWKSPTAARIYAHIDVSAEARKADLLPTAARKLGDGR